MAQCEEYARIWDFATKHGRTEYSLVQEDVRCSAGMTMAAARMCYVDVFQTLDYPYRFRSN